MPEPMSRRSVIQAGSLTLVALVAGCSGDDLAETDAASHSADAVDPDAIDCIVTPDQQTGPFYVNAETRRDVTEGMPGAKMVVRMQLVDAAQCLPLAGLPVDIWSASAEGLYSGVDNSIVRRGGEDTQGETFMRGRQVTDDSGVVVFETLFPGWYEVTSPHFHFTAPFDEESSFTWQLYLDDTFSDTVYTTVAPYDERGVHPNRTDDRNVPSELVITPTGTPVEPMIDLVVGIDLDDLSGPPPEFEA